MARNPRPNTMTTVTPNIRPIDTFVQPAPIDNTRLKELDAFGTFDPVNVSDNEHWLISKYKSHLSSSSAREVHETSQLLEYYIKEMN